MRVILPLLSVALILLCANPTPDEVATCNAICSELFVECAYEAYPTMDSCLEGCGYNEAQGADLDQQLACIEQAACDTFAIVECEHEHGRQ